MQIRRVRPGDGPDLRALRLRALEDAPTAFGQTLADARAKPDEHWESWAASETTATYAGIDDGVWLGMAGGYVMHDEPASAMLFGMWVDPRVRGTGLAADLVAHVLAWARTTPCERLTLWVTDGNARARRFYGRCGFTLTDGEIPLPSHPEHTLVRMAIALR